jgi:stage II sporulation protein AA (anti-sigma F factor antagonist)
MDQFKIDVSYDGTNNEIVVVTPHGYIDATTCPDVEKEILKQLSKECYKIIVHLPYCEYVNSSGWGVFIREIKDIRQHQGDLVLADMSPDVHMVYETMEFSKILKSFPSLRESVSYFYTGIG